MRELLRRLWREDEGQDLTEYALLLALISLIAIAAIRTLGVEIGDVFLSTARHIPLHPPH